MASAMQPLLVRSFIVLGAHGGAGLTPVTGELVLALRRLGVQALGMKPWARSDELRQLSAASALGLPARAFCSALYAGEGGAAPTLDMVVDTFRALATWADAVVVDGVDRVGFDGSALGRALQLPFVYVVGTQVEQALVHAQALARSGLEAVGWLGDPAARMPGEWLGRDAARLALRARSVQKVLELRA